VTEWRDPEAPWAAKFRRAAVHIAELKGLVREFERDDPWSVEPVAGDGPNEVGFRLRVHRPIPADLITVVGDAVHNLRSALDSVAYELAVRHVGGPLQASQETQAMFPIKKTGLDFDEFFKNPQRDVMYGQQERLALRCAQPFAMAEEMTAHGIDPGSTPEQDLMLNELYRLHTVSNIDKHRRLPVVSWFPESAYWTSNEDGAIYGWRPAPLPTQFEDGAMLGYLFDPIGDVPPPVRVYHEMHLTLMDDPLARGSLVAVLDGWYRSLAGWILPRVVAVAEGNPAPMMILSQLPPPA
jgi:hypothetical protein